MVKIICPNKQYSGVSASVDFTKGVGETDDKYLIKWFKSHGYKVEEEKDKKEEDKKEENELNIELEDMSQEELIQFAKDNEIDIGKATSKDGILKKIEEAKEV